MKNPRLRFAALFTAPVRAEPCLPSRGYGREDAED